MSRKANVIVEVPWPRFPTRTPKGAISKSKKAGHRIPWLNANAVNNLHRRTHQQCKILWRQEAQDQACAQAPFVGLADHPEDHHEPHTLETHGLLYPVTIRLQLFAAAKRGRDVAGLIEGVKPIIDGFVLAGLLVDDDPEWVRGFSADEPIIVGRDGNAGVRVTLEAAA